MKLSPGKVCSIAFTILAALAFAAGNSQASSCTPPPAGLVGWWKGDGNTLDSFGANNGVNQNISFSNGVVGQAFACDPENFSYGTYTGIQIADQPAYALTNSLTIEGWIRPRGDSYIIFWRGDQRPGLDPYFLGMEGNNHLIFNICDADGNSANVGMAVNYSSWIHVAGTLDGSTGRLSFYTNGVLAAYTNTGIRPFGNLLPDQSPGVGIGNLNDGGNNFPFIGDIDEISLYNRALSAGEIQAIYSAGSAGKCAPAPPTAGPAISGFTPASGASGTLVTISGTNFSPIVAGNIVRFGAFQAAVLSASPTLLTAVVPARAIRGPLTVTVNGLTAYASLPFLTTFPNPASRVVVWGENLDGQTNIPSGLTNVIAIAAGAVADHSLALKTDGTVVAWGYNYSGQATVPAGLNNVIEIAGGYAHNLVLKGDGTVAAWGYNNNPYDSSDSNQGTVPASLSHAIAIAAGWYHSLALKPDGTVLAWGANSHGETNVPPGLSNVVAIAGAPSYSMALKIDGTVATWGSNFQNSVVVPMNPPPGLSNVVAIAAGYFHCLALKADGTIVSWGDNTYGQTNVPAGLANVVAIAAGAYHNLAVKADGTLVAWGINYPWLINVPAGLSNVVAVSAGYFHSLALMNDSSVGTPLISSPPIISNLMPASGTMGTVVTISGTNFSPTAASNIVYFGAVRATVSAASPTSLTVTVPAGATYAPITVTVNSLTAYGSHPFLPTFSGNGQITNSTLAARLDLPAGLGSAQVVIADLDGDGKPDLAIANSYGGNLSIYRNISTNGSLTAGSFGSRVDVPVLLPSSGTSPYTIAAADVDGDGRLDLIAINADSNIISILRNISSPGILTTNSFAARMDVPSGNVLRGVALRDLNGDGKPELVAVNQTSPGSISVFQNLSSSGNIAFAARVDFAVGNIPQGIAIGDLDGDGQPDLAVANYGSGTISIFRNAGIGGNITPNSFAPKVDLPALTTVGSIAIGDLDGDGKLDLVTGSGSISGSQAISVYRNMATAGSITTNTFAPQVDFAAGWVNTVALADLDGDGKLDIALASQGPSVFSIFKNVSVPGSFTSASLAARVDYSTGYNPVGLAVGDLDGDGRPDIAFGNVYDATISIYRNQMPVVVAPPAMNPPVVTGLIPAVGAPGTVVTISGTNFNPTAASNIVYFGAVRAIVSAASPTSLTVTVPTGATYAPVTVTVGGLIAYASAPFGVTFAGSGSTALAPRLDLPAIDGAGQVVYADLDGDGKPDLLVASGNQGISIYQNISTSNTVTAATFAPRVDLQLPTGLDAITAADVDGDGKLDIVFLNRNSNQVGILKNISAGGSITTNSFAAPVAFPTGSDPRGIVVRDLDGDGKPELAVASWGDGTVSVYQHTSAADVSTNTFALIGTFTVGASPQSLGVADLDGDGKPDLITANNNYGTTNSVSLLRNTSTPGNISFAPQVAIAGLATSYCLAIGDLDGDGKLDLAVSSFDYGQAVSVYRNTSTPGSLTTGSFAPHVDFDAGGWGNAVAIGDLDGDGKPDLAVVTQLPDHFSIFKNISSPGGFTTISLAPRVDYSAGWNPNGVAIGDLDGDGRPDISFAVTYAATLSIYQNQLPSNTGSSTTNPPAITGIVPQIGTPASIVTISGTNFSAIASANIVYFGAARAVVSSASPTNLTVTVPAGATFGPVTVTAGGLTAYSGQLFEPTFTGNGSNITSSSFAPSFNLPGANGPQSMVIADLDGDGKPDIAFVNGYNNLISIYQNISTNGALLGAASFAPRLDLLPATNGVIGSSYRLRAADLDGDGRLDLIVCDVNSDHISIFHNIAAPGSLTTNSFEAPFTLNASYDTRFATAADLDGDGRVDIVALNYGAKTISIYRNVGTTGALNANSFAAPASLAAPGGPYEAVIADLDGDGKPDLAVANSDSGTVSVYQNLASPGVITSNSFAPPVEMSGGGGNTSTIIAVDLDGDGKLDLVSGSGTGDSVNVFRNISAGGLLTTNSFAARVDFGTPGWMHTVSVADFNGDGKPDLGVVGELDSYMAIFQNAATPGSFTANSFAPRVDFATGYNAWGIVVGDLDGDGRPDVVFGNYYDNTVQIYQNVMPFGTNTPPPSASLIVNGGFENPPGIYPYSVYSPETPMPGWVVESGTVEITGTYWQAAEGTQSLDLNGIFDEIGTIYQDFATTPGQNYKVRFAYAGNPDCDSPTLKTANAFWNGQLLTNLSFDITGHSLTNLGWIYYEQIVTATATNCRIRFQATSPTFCGLTLDDVSVTPTSQSPPPSTPPAIVSQTPSQVVLLGNPATFNVTVSGTDPLSYFWSRNNVLIPGATNFSYTLGNAQLSDSGSKFNCLVTNAYGFAASTNATLKVIDSISNDLCSGAIVVTGLNYTNFQSTAKATSFGDPFPDCVDSFGNGVWYQFTALVNGVLVVDTFGSDFDTGLAVYTGACGSQTEVACNDDTGGMTSQVTIPTTAGTTYSILVGGYGAHTGNLVFHLTHLTPPAFVVQPANQSVVTGSNASFSATLTGALPMSFQWSYLNGTPLVDDGRIAGSTTASLTISNITTADAGSYVLSATNFLGFASSTAAVLNVLVPPTISTQPIGRSVPPGLPTTFNAAATGNPTPNYYQWQFNGTNIPGATSSTYTIGAVNTNHLGIYHLVVSNSVGGTVSADAQLTFGPVAAWGRNLSNESLPLPNLTNVAAVAGTFGASFAVRTDGRVVAWGSGAATNIPASVSNVVAVSAYSGFANYALRSDGTVVGWGGPTAPPVSNIVAVAAGNSFTYALRAEGTLTNWGSGPTPGFPAGLNHLAGIAAGGNNAIALRNDSTIVVSGGGVVTNVPGGTTNVIAVAVGDTFAMALKADGRVVAWGTGTVTNLPAGLTNVVAISAGNNKGENYGVAIRANGGLVAWGDNTLGESTPPAALSNLVSIAGTAAAYHGLALVNDGSPVILHSPVGLTTFSGRDVTLRGDAAGAQPLNYQWLLNGTNVPGATSNSLFISNVQFANAGKYQLFVSNSISTAISLPAPVNVASNNTLTFLTQVTASPTNLYQGGKFTVGGATVLGNGPLRYQWFFSRTNNNYAAVAGATNDTLTMDPALAFHTGNYYLAISNQFAGVTTAPVAVRVLFARAWGYQAVSNPPVNLTNTIALATGGNTGIGNSTYFALGSDGKLTSWANAGYFPVYAETNVSALSNSFVTAIAAGYQTSLALRSDGTVYAWGYGGNGQTNPPSGLNGVTAISVGGYHDLALKSDGTVVGWGATPQNNFGQATNNPAATNVVAISAGLQHSSALRADGTVVSWGDNTKDLTQIPSSVTNVIAIVAGSGFNVALRANGTVVQWGSGMISYPVPANLSNVVAISGSGTHCTALKNDGTVVSWGNAYVGLASNNVPSDVANVIAITSGGDRDFALFGTRAPAFTVQPWNRSIPVSARSNIVLAAKCAGVQPVSYQWQLNGTNVPGATNDMLVLTNQPSAQFGTIRFIPTGSYQLIASNAYGIAFSKPAKITTVIPLGEALDATNLNWSTSGSAQWFGQTNYVHPVVATVNSSAARSGGIGALQETILQTTFATNVAGSVIFWWKVSSEQFYDTLEFRINGTVQASISGEVDWTQASFPLTAGTNVLMWRYSKDVSFDSGLDAAFVDQFSFAAAPVITRQPSGVVANLGDVVSLSVIATGTAPLRYQWFRNGSPMSSQISSTYTMLNVARAQSGTYSVIVTNSGGVVVSSNATVLVKVPQLLGTPVLLPNGTLQFSSTDANGGLLSPSDLANFEAQASTNLVNWVTLPNALSLTNGMLQLQDSGQLNYNARYYRLIEH